MTPISDLIDLTAALVTALLAHVVIQTPRSCAPGIKPVLYWVGNKHLSRPQNSFSSQRRPLNTLLSWITNLFPVNILVQDVDGLISAAEQTLATVLGIDTTEDLSSNCATVTIIFARGTTEAGNVGALVGPPFFDAVQAQLPTASTLAIQGVDYPASVPGFLEGGDPAGSQQMAADVTQALSACPSTKLVMSGYSQGGQIVHNAAKLLPAATMAKVSSVVIFGDPDYPTPVVNVPASQQLVICHAGDNICQAGDLILLPHLTYAIDADQAAAFVVAQL
ncbi:cutinase [Diplogelasinospora grovesii]|uniref:Cutinase n=1 Tax=Diplogelasinospora grovesii TaxID=303347 RepID=A0AAN6MVH9_9PEZI|nr:cutinase [Diplogelasinospora grovesii]